jgi:hypothetical protein
MTVEQKIEIVKEFNEAAIAALNSYLDSLYNMTDEYFDEKGNLIEGLTPDKKVETFIKSLRDESVKFENIRRKLINKDFKLSLYEINLIAAAFIFVSGVWEKDITKLQKAKEEADKVIKNLTSPKE